MLDAEANRRLTLGLDLLSRVREDLERASPKGDLEVKVLDYSIMLMYSRSRSLFEGIHVLIREHLAEEAIALARSLFEESLRLMHLAREGDLRWRYVVGWIRESIGHKRSLVGDATSEEGRLKASERLRQLDEEEVQLRKAMKRLGVVTEKRFTSIENLATIHGRLEDLWPYEVGHRMIHGSQIALAYRSSKGHLVNSEDRYMLRVRSEEPIPKLIAIVFGLRSILFAHESAAEIFHFIPHLEKSDEFFSELEALQQA